MAQQDHASLEEEIRKRERLLQQMEVEQLKRKEKEPQQKKLERLERDKARFDQLAASQAALSSRVSDTTSVVAGPASTHPHPHPVSTSAVGQQTEYRRRPAVQISLPQSMPRRQQAPPTPPAPRIRPTAPPQLAQQDTRSEYVRGPPPPPPRQPQMVPQPSQQPPQNTGWQEQRGRGSGFGQSRQSTPDPAHVAPQQPQPGLRGTRFAPLAGLHDAQPWHDFREQEQERVRLATEANARRIKAISDRQERERLARRQLPPGGGQ
ncbi:hypothetical protein K402DRAFT_396093 [Aulographum hederae CBS 113979]|uniref:Uncharacterized protein n=1 Tax=Aulographum hederae CBS 113979 TaxID=1176131 RepID=A0A6G1GTP7_9PEZI|nr:hypothetical protein K402DRAFT_396093 [Aulographum hederae CBS 113979]